MNIRRSQPLKIFPNNSVVAAGEAQSPRTLWITGPSVRLRQRLVKSVGLRSATIMRLLDSDLSDALSPHTLDLIANAIRSGKLRSVVICGETGDVSSRTGRGSRCGNSADSTYEHLLLRMSNHRQHRQRAQNRVKTQFQQMRSHAGVAHALKSNGVSLFGMFYLPEAETFLLFDESQGDFSPLCCGLENREG